MVGNIILKAGAATLALLCAGIGSAHPTLAQEGAAAEIVGAAVASPEPLSAGELEILVARIALYPDELIAVITAASLYPLQIVEAARFLDQHEKNESLKPKPGWDGSVVSLLNYPDIVRMMSDDLDWTQQLGNAIAYQQKDVLIAIQQLRDEAIARGVIRTDDRIQVVEENDNVVIRPASPEVIYVPQYEPRMFYEPDYVWVPVWYYPDPYPNYWYPTATFFAGFVTGAVWGAIIDWDDWDVWGGRWDGGDIHIDCNDCFNDRHFDGKINFNDVDWTKIDRDRISIDREQFDRLDRGSRIGGGSNAISDRARDIRKGESADRRPGTATGTKDVRKSTLEGLKAKPADATGPAGKPIGKKPAARSSAVDRSAGKPATIDREVGGPKPAAKVDNRPKKPSDPGNVSRGKQTRVDSDRGRESMGGGSQGGTRKKLKRPGGGSRH